jgi:hypothetical protein
MLILISACKNKNASILKVYVRSADNSLVNEAMVTVIGDQTSSTKTLAYVDTNMTNQSGIVEINMQPYFDLAGEKSNPTGVFTIICRKDSIEGEASVRCRVHNTAIQTVYLPN